MPIANPHFFVCPPERGEIGQSSSRLVHFHLRPLKTGGSLSNDVLLHHCIQTVVLNHLNILKITADENIYNVAWLKSSCVCNVCKQNLVKRM